MSLMKILELLEKETSAEVYLTGKYVRNVIRKKKHFGTIEVVACNVSFKDLLGWLKKHGKIKRIGTIKKGSPTIIFKTDGDSREATIRLPVKGKSLTSKFSIKNDASSSDFTINALYLPIKSKAVKDNIIDPFGGLRDIQYKKIRTIGKPQIVIEHNPIVMFRAIALSAELRYKVESNLFYAIKVSANQIEKADINELRRLFVEIILSPKPSRQFKLMHDIGLLGVILPELDVCYGISQNKKYHKHDVFTHCILACDSAEQDLIIRLAALLHDVGKAPTREEHRNGKEVKITFYSHEVVSTKLAKKALRRLGFDKDTIKAVCNLVYLHMYNYEPEKWTDAAVRRFIAKAGITKENIEEISELPLFRLRRAERMSYGHNMHITSIRQQQFEERLKQVFEKTDAITVGDMDVTGTDIMEVFNLRPGPTVGNILNYLLKIVTEDPEVNEKERLIAIAADYLSEALK